MEKNQEMPPPYTAAPGGVGYNGQPQAQPGYGCNYNQSQGQPQPMPGQPPFQYAQHNQYPIVVLQQPLAPPVSQGPPPRDHMTAAIIVTLCCFWPTGVIALIKANEAKNAYIRGDMASANIYARTAKNMITVSIIAGICSFILVGIIVGLYWGLVLSNIQYTNYDD